jgi:regulator of sigma E protease
VPVNREVLREVDVLLPRRLPVPCVRPEGERPFPVGEKEIDGLKTVLLTILVFGVIITLHELGHFAFCKLFGVRVHEFSFGMGPRLFGWGKGETQYSIRLLPIGGYVAMEGEDEESQDGRAFCNRPPWQRFIILFAGAGMNLLLGLVLLGISTGQMELLGTNVVARIEEGAASAAYLQSGDRIIEVNGYNTPCYNDVVFQLIRDEDGVVDLTVQRGGDLSMSGWERFLAGLGIGEKNPGERVVLSQVPFEMEDVGGGQRSLKIDFVFYGAEPNLANSVVYTFQWTVSTVKQVWYSLLDIVTGRFGLSQLSGPVGTATVIQQASDQGLRSLVILVAYITINVGVFNLLPIPALDGGRMFFLLVGMLLRRPIPAKYEAYINAAGMILLLAFVGVVTFSDIMKLFAGP